MSYQFQGQRPHERVLLVTHQHPFVLLHPVLWATFVFLVPFAVFAISPTGLILAVTIVLAIIIGITIAHHAWYSWNRTTVMLTTDRIIFLEQRGFFKRELTELPLHSIHQVSHSVSGILHTLFGFGTVTVATIGAQQPMTISNVPDPYAIQQEILQTQNGEGFVEEEEEVDE